MPSVLDTRFGSLALTYEPMVQKEKVTPPPQAPIQEIAEKWIGNFNEAIRSKNSDAVAALFQDDGWWRDVLAMTWGFHTYQSVNSIKDMIERNNTEDIGLANFTLDTTKPIMLNCLAPAIGQCIFAYFLFETRVGHGKGVVSLSSADETGHQWKAFTFYTSLQELKGHEEKIGSRRRTGVDQGDLQTWLEKRNQLENMEGLEPTVLVVGSGQSGLNIAARLGMLDVITLIIEKNERVGDNWRKRYKSLVLHDPVWYDHMSYLPFPQSWPIFSPKDKLADWFEAYAKVMELNVWTSTTIQGIPKFDSEMRTWTVNVQRADGTERILHPRHIILATGHSGEPHVPKFPGTETFKGDIHHSSQHPGGDKYRGKRAIIIGCCNSGHDIAREFFDYGAESVTMIQRSSTYVMSQANGLRHLLGGLYDENGLPTEDADLFFSSIPYPVLKIIHQEATRKIAEDDVEILKKLQLAGFKLDYGFDGSGIFIKYLLTGGGYYIDVGCSDLIGDGKIKVKQGKEVSKIVEDGVVFEDGTKLEADVIVLATGYSNMRQTARNIFGDEVADRVKDVWGFNGEGEIATMWQKSGKEGLWFMGGNLALTRAYSRFLAVQIKAAELGLNSEGRF